MSSGEAWVVMDESDQPLQQVHYSDDQTSNQKEQQNDSADYDYLKFSIALLIRRG
jgi:hypothetical protein